MGFKEKFYNSAKELSNVQSLVALAMLLAIRVIVGIFANSTMALFGNMLKISINFSICSSTSNTGYFFFSYGRNGFF